MTNELPKILPLQHRPDLLGAVQAPAGHSPRTEAPTILPDAIGLADARSVAEYAPVPTSADCKAPALRVQGPDRTLKPIPRTNMKAMTVKILKDQGGLCLLCKCRIDLSIPKEGCLDHDHESGEVRGVLHRSCNAAEGKVANAAGRWGAKGMSYELIVPWLENLLAYYKGAGTGYMYPGHKSPEQKAVAARLKRNTRAAEKRATAKVRTMSFKPKVNP